jgi:hypothetical protein
MTERIIITEGIAPVDLIQNDEGKLHWWIAILEYDLSRLHKALRKLHAQQEAENRGGSRKLGLETGEGLHDRTV